MTEDSQGGWRTAEEKALDIAQARALMSSAAKGGLRFEVYLPSELAAWVLDFVERGVFVDPGEAVFIILGEHRDLEPHADLRQEALRRSIQAALDDPRPGIPLAEVKAHMAKLLAEPRSEPAVWRQRPPVDAGFESDGMEYPDFQIGMEFMTATGVGG